MARPAALVVPLVVALLATTCSERAAAAPAPAPVTYVEPVEGVIVDHFRPPPGPYTAGNRGLDYAAVPGSRVRAAADGEVIFAGQVAGALHVTIRHADGLRTTYSFLATVSVSAGQRVEQGDEVGTSGPLFHFGARAPDDTYLDPEALFARAAPRVVVRLVPGVDEGRPALAEHERAALLDLVRTEGARLRATLEDLSPDELRLLAHYALVLRPDRRAAHVGERMLAWHRQRDRCTPLAEPTPALTTRHIVVLVGGLGSSSEAAAIDRLDTAALGYAPGDVIRFSYRGGRIPAADPAQVTSRLRTLPVSTYTSVDSQGDLQIAGDQLAELLGEVARAEPGVPIDVVAHSQGGVVARLALDNPADGSPPLDVTTLVTLGSPHEGSDLATAVVAARTSAQGTEVISRFRAAFGLDVDPAAPAVGELAETSELISHLKATPGPGGVDVVSIGARGDLVVPAERTALDGAEEVIVPLVGLHAHDALPADPAATREVALAVTGRPPTCDTLAQALVDAVVAESVAGVEDLGGLAALVGPGLA